MKTNIDTYKEVSPTNVLYKTLINIVLLPLEVPFLQNLHFKIYTVNKRQYTTSNTQYNK